MTSFNKILLLLRKDFLLEWRKKYSLYGLLLYICSAVFTIKMLQDNAEGETWNTLFWLLLLFVCVNAVAKSFLQENKKRFLYYYTVHHPRDIIVSKLIYNVIIMMLMSVLTVILFIFLIGNPVLHIQNFFLMVFIGGISLSLLFTTLAAIAGRADGNATLIAVLGFPIVIPQIILLADLCKPLFINMHVSGWWYYFFSLLLLDVLIIILSIILFPFIWKE